MVVAGMSVVEINCECTVDVVPVYCVTAHAFVVFPSCVPHVHRR